MAATSSLRVVKLVARVNKQTPVTVQLGTYLSGEAGMLVLGTCAPSALARRLTPRAATQYQALKIKDQMRLQTVPWEVGHRYALVRAETGEQLEEAGVVRYDMDSDFVDVVSTKLAHVLLHIYLGAPPELWVGRRLFELQEDGPDAVAGPFAIVKGPATRITRWDEASLGALERVVAAH